MFARPVDRQYPIKRYFGEVGRRYHWSVDPDTGFWVPIQFHSVGRHRGTDFDCPEGTLVRSMADGIVTSVRHEDKTDPSAGAGLYITQLVNLLGYDSWLVKYSHLKAAYVKLGQKIYKHDPIAESGRSGKTDGPYLHVEMVDLAHQYKAIQFEFE